MSAQDAIAPRCLDPVEPTPLCRYSDHFIIFFSRPPTMKPRNKVSFTEEDDALLMKYIATYKPQPKGRLGMKLYEKLVENVRAALHVVQCD